MYYVTTGKWQNDQKLNGRIENEIETLEELNIFGKISFVPVDARKLQKLYNRAKNRLSKTITFSGKVTLPSLPDIQESYLGFLPITEYLKLITDDSGGILRSLFYDNIRDFQGDNTVNKEIVATLSSPEKALFVLMNNGITIVAESINKTGDQFTIEDYQIVNGCQTSHILFNHRAKVSEDIQLPVKLIVSQNAEVKNQIIKATNRQTPVRTEELTALTDFQKSIEAYYEATLDDSRLYYERRSQQYRSATGIEKIRIVSISNQIRCFASMFLRLPHQASRYYGTLLKTIEGKIFVSGHPPIAYYVAALALYRIESLLRKNVIARKYRPFKYHIIAILRMQIIGVHVPNMAANAFERSCNKIVTALSGEAKSKKTIQAAIDVLDTVFSGDFNRDRAKDSTLLSVAEVLCADT